MNRRRSLSEEERALWGSIAHSIKPLRIAQKTEPPPASTTPPPAAVEPRVAVPPRVKSATSGSPLTALDRRLRQRVARGREPIGDRIDLHGLTQRQAHAALLRFLERAQTNGERLVLVVTGKGAGSGRNIGMEQSGVLRRQVPLWFALPEFRAFVVGFESAHVRHGGEGALYVRLRRRREPDR